MILTGKSAILAVLAIVGLVQAAPAMHKRQTQSGPATFFTPGLGSCGITSSATDHIVAVSSSFFDTFSGATANPNANPVCGRKMTVSFQGKSTAVTVVDRCPGCGPTGIDLSPAAFNELASPDLGRIQVTWTLH
ncbi:RlpA-like double-psi beta-barrel-protein domain-containing protein-containing protein [Irpex rosettiformis]|uniref:RlpA-like double-psi beta-barrel-protein domain-containing protein-containing protein n=1 Tax=Irpex rosettiformis TaxID=378272 RepID=A0ACB8UDR8_9APHY|nr:RlpA-like double-psi beta-barrel-protein domain-containing protein-containing protein [Irpex rosettiformis]